MCGSARYLSCRIGLTQASGRLEGSNVKHRFLVCFQQSSVAPDLAVTRECWPFKISLVTELCSSMERKPTISRSFKARAGLTVLTFPDLEPGEVPGEWPAWTNGEEHSSTGFHTSQFSPPCISSAQIMLTVGRHPLQLS